VSTYLHAALVRLVRDRAGDACEYCRLSQHLQEARFHVDHILPRSRGGLTNIDNLALACVTCSLKKAARTHARDPRSKLIVPLYNPRQHHWPDHLRANRTGRLIGRSPIGRATIRALGMNRPAIVVIRRTMIMVTSALGGL